MPATNPSAVLAAVTDRLQNHLAPHPRLLLDRTGQQQLAARIGKDPRLSKLYQRLLDHADALIKQQPVTRKMTGRRMNSGGAITDRVINCALAYRLTSDARFLHFARDTMLDAAGYEDWHPDHFLDVAEVTLGLSIGYDWLYNDLSPEERQTIRTALLQKGIEPSYKGGPTMWWVSGDNNWNQVCHGSLILASLAMAEEEPELAAKTIARAVDNLPIAVKHYEPDGAYPEGMGYWGYGTTRNVIALAALQSAIGDDFGLTTSGLLKSASYHLNLLGPSVRSFSYSDSHETDATGASAAAFWLAGQAKDPSLLYNEIANLDRLLSQPAAGAGGGDSNDWHLLLTVPQDAKQITPAQTHYVAAGDTPVSTHRTSWDKDATFIAIKGGSPGTNHGHMDVGSFCLDALGVRWAGDLGAQDYNSLESKGINLWSSHQGSQRWQIFRLGPLSHNILTVDGQEQVVKASAPITRSTDSFTLINLAPVYAGQLAAAERGIQLRPDGSVRLQDEIRATEKPSTLRWAMLTTANVKTKGPTATLSDKGKTLTLTVASPAKAVLKIVATDPPPHDYDAPNPGTRLITFEVKLQPGQAESLVVDFTPGKPPTTQPAITPLADWK